MKKRDLKTVGAFPFAATPLIDRKTFIAYAGPQADGKRTLWCQPAGLRVAKK